MKTIFLLDSLSELSSICMKMVVGNKPTAAPPDWRRRAANNLMNLLPVTWTQGFTPTVGSMTERTFQRQTNEITGGVRPDGQRRSGRRWGTKSRSLFSEVIYTRRRGHGLALGHGSDRGHDEDPVSADLGEDQA